MLYLVVFWFADGCKLCRVIWREQCSLYCLFRRLTLWCKLISVLGFQWWWEIRSISYPCFYQLLTEAASLISLTLMRYSIPFNVLRDVSYFLLACRCLCILESVRSIVLTAVWYCRGFWGECGRRKGLSLPDRLWTLFLVLVVCGALLWGTVIIPWLLVFRSQLWPAFVSNSSIFSITVVYCFSDML